MLHMTAIRLQLALTRPAGADAAAQTGKILALTRQSRGGIFELCQLYLQLSLAADRVESENVQDQDGTVDDAHVAADLVLQIADLGRGELGVKDHQGDLVPTA